MVLWPVANPDTSRSVESHHSTDHRGRVGSRPSCFSNTLRSSCTVRLLSSLQWNHRSQDQLLLLRLERRHTAPLFHGFSYLILSQTQGGIEPMLLESCLKQRSDRAAARSWPAGGGVSALVQHVSGALLGTSPHQKPALSSYLPSTELLFFFAGWHLLCQHPTFGRLHPVLPVLPVSGSTVSGPWSTSPGLGQLVL